MDFGAPSTWRLIWLAAMVIFALGEIAMAGSFFLAPFAFGALVAALCAFAGVSVGMQWFVFVVASAVSFLAMRPLAHRLDQRTQTAGIGANRLIGREALVTQEIGSTSGMVRLDGEQWRAEAADGGGIAVDQSVEITEVRGTRVVVVPSVSPRSNPS